MEKQLNGIRDLRGRGLLLVSARRSSEVHEYQQQFVPEWR